MMMAVAARPTPNSVVMVVVKPVSCVNRSKILWIAFRVYHPFSQRASDAILRRSCALTARWPMANTTVAAAKGQERTNAAAAPK